MTDAAPGPVASVVGSGFTNRLAAHLADVKNADKAHRIVRSETDQKLEALQRMAYEQAGEIERLSARLPDDLQAQVDERVATHDEGPGDALIAILSGNTEEPCEGCGDPWAGLSDVAKLDEARKAAAAKAATDQAEDRV